MPLAVHGPVTQIGVFGKVPCPFCGLETSSRSPTSAIVRGGGGLPGIIVAAAFVGTYYCAVHGRILLRDYPAQHRRMIVLRKLIAFGIAFLLLILGIAILFCVAGLLNQ